MLNMVDIGPGGAGVVYHPEYDQFLTQDPVARRELVRQLRANADESNTEGDRLLLVRDWGRSNRCWKYAARCMRAAQAMAFSKPVNQVDYPIVGQAWSQTRGTGSQLPREWGDLL